MGHHRGGRFHVDREFAAEATANFAGNHLDLRDRKLQHFGELGPDLERPLSADPDRDRAVLLPEDGRVVRLDVTLVDGGGVELPLDDDLGLGKTLLEVPHLVLVVAGDVALPPRILPQGLGGAVVVEQRRPFFHRFAHVDDSRKRLVLDFDQGQRFFGDVGACRRDRGDGMALVQNLVRRQAVLGDFADVDQGLSDVRQLVDRFDEVVGGGDGADPLDLERPARVDGKDAGMGMGTAQHLPVKRIGQSDVCSVNRPAGHLVVAVMADRTGADDLVLAVAGEIGIVWLRCHVVFSRRLVYWCGSGDSNPDARRHCPLKTACLPIPPLPHDSEIPGIHYRSEPSPAGGASVSVSPPRTDGFSTCSPTDCSKSGS